MRCYACNLDIGATGYDKATERYYCSPCFEAANDVILSRFEEEMDPHPGKGWERPDPFLDLEWSGDFVEDEVYIDKEEDDDESSFS